MGNSFYIQISAAIFLQALLKLLTVKLRSWDAKYSGLEFKNGFFVIGTILLFFAAYLGISVLVICQLSVLFILSYMDYKVKEVYSFLIIVYAALSGVVCVYNLKNEIEALLLGVILYLLFFLKVYAHSDGVVMFGIVQSMAFITRNYVVNSIVCFICIQCLIVIYYILNKYIGHKKDVSDKTVPVLPFVTGVFYMWIIFEKVL